jgi:hypothetical protein
MTTSEEWKVVTRAVAIQLAQERIFGTDRTLPVKIEAILSAKHAELNRLIPSATEAEIPVDGERIVEEGKRLIEEQALLVIARVYAQRNYEMLKDMPKPYIALHGLLTLSRTFRATLHGRCAELLGWHGLSAAERARAVEMIQTADLDEPLD